MQNIVRMSWHCLGWDTHARTHARAHTHTHTGMVCMHRDRMLPPSLPPSLHHYIYSSNLNAGAPHDLALVIPRNKHTRRQGSQLAVTVFHVHELLCGNSLECVSLEVATIINHHHPCLVHSIPTQMRIHATQTAPCKDLEFGFGLVVVPESRHEECSGVAATAQLADKDQGDVQAAA